MVCATIKRNEQKMMAKEEEAQKKDVELVDEKKRMQKNFKMGNAFSMRYIDVGTSLTFDAGGCIMKLFNYVDQFLAKQILNGGPAVDGVASFGHIVQIFV